MGDVFREFIGLVKSSSIASGTMKKRTNVGFLGFFENKVKEGPVHDCFLLLQLLFRLLPTGRIAQRLRLFPVFRDRSDIG